MPTDSDYPDSKNDRRPFLGLTGAEIDAAVTGLGWPRFRAEQVLRWVYDKAVTDPSRMTNLSARDAATLAGYFSFSTASVVKHQKSTDGTQKLLLGWGEDAKADTAQADTAQADTAKAETVLIPDDDRQTICVSSQVGCPVGCHFCASGIDGVARNLTAAQIVEQVIGGEPALWRPGRPPPCQTGPCQSCRLHGHGRATGQLR